jgi:carbamoyltransferase
MLVLGITNNDLAGACLVRDDVILAAASEERFSRVKDHKTWPEKSIEFVLRSGNCTLADIDYIAYGWNAGFDADKHLLLYFDRIVEEAQHHKEGLPHVRKRIHDEIENDKRSRREFDEFVARNGLKSKVVYVDHHECHALGAFICSPFEESLVMTCDGRGDFQSLTVSHYKGGSGKVLLQETTIDSLGYFYGRITKLLGFIPNRHEGKITGLAAHGDPEKLLPLMRKMIDYKDGHLRAKCGPYYQPSYEGYSEELLQIIKAEKPEDVAAAAQTHVENLLTQIAADQIKATNVKNVCLAGGVFANVKLNQRILETTGARNVYVFPPMGDGGLALAAAVSVPYKQGLRPKSPSMFLGPDAGDTQENLKLLKTNYPKLRHFKPDDIQSVILDALQKNQVVGLCRGRMEFGPRALCNRTILYRTDDVTMNDWLNKRFKRTEFMPFAPVSAEEFAPQCYINWKREDVSARFMTITYDCTPEFRAASPGVVHIDNTARPQIIRAVDDPFMHKLLLAWHERSKQAALVNTSFNKHEEPIICGAKDAFDALNDEIVDIVVLNDEVILWKDGVNAFMTQRYA